MKEVILTFSILAFAILVVNVVSALDTSDLSIAGKNRLEFGHVLWVKDIQTEPMELIPGNIGTLKLNVYNTGEMTTKDIRVELILPSEISFTNDVSEKKISEIKPDKSIAFNFSILTLPKTAEGVYKASLKVTYINSIGEERKDNYSLGLIVKSTPKIFANIEKTGIYDESRIGDVTITFTNNDVGNVKFLTIELENSDDYEIISETKKYIGALDSDDFQSAIVRMKVREGVKKITIPIKITYKDSLNKDYSEEIKVDMNIRTAKELGIEKNNYYLWIIIVLVLVSIGIYFYRKRVNRRKYG